MIFLRRAFVAFWTAAAFLLMLGSANAETVAANRVAFTWLRAQGAETCPAQEALAEDLRNALGPEVLDSGVSRKIEAIVSKSDETWRVAIYERVGLEPRFFREISKDAPDCEPITKATMAILKILIDAGPIPDPRPPPCPICKDEVACTPCPKPSPWKTSLVARGAIRYGILPDFAPDVGLFTGLSHKRWEISAGMSWMPEVLHDGVALGMNTAWLGGCFHMRQSPKPVLSICGYGLASRIHAYSAAKGVDLENPGEQTWGAFAVAPRLRHAFSWLFFEVGIDVIVPLNEYSYSVTKVLDPSLPANTFSQRPVAGSAFLGLGVSIP